MGSTAPHPRGGSFGTAPGFARFYTAVVVVQGVHVLEHVLQLLQVYVLGVPDDDALGLLGYLFQLNGTEEYLHLVFNVSYFLAPVVVLAGVAQRTKAGLLPPGAPMFAWLAVVLEGWHLVEHVVIISHAIANGGCPCPGIGDVALGVSDTQLHFVYNVAAYAATLVPYRLMRTARPAAPVRTG